MIQDNQDTPTTPATKALPSSSGSDSRLAYILCHLIAALKNVAVFGAIVWLSYALDNGAVLWALLICPWSTYKHDFNQNRENTP